MLAIREHSRCELAHKLSARDFSEAEIESALDELEAESYLSDRRFAEAYIRARAQRGFGPLSIENELQQRGVTSEIIESALEKAEIDWSALVQKVFAKKFGNNPLPKDFSERAKCLRFLQTRGFSNDTIAEWQR